jgi:hypothetical protein
LGSFGAGSESDRVGHGESDSGGGEEELGSFGAEGRALSVERMPLWTQIL